MEIVIIVYNALARKRKSLLANRLSTNRQIILIAK